eukprot:1187143-Prorocentrum_minimum.AAC.1
MSLWGVVWALAVTGKGGPGVDSGTEGLDSGTEGVDSGTERLDSGTEGLDSGTEGPISAIQSATSWLNARVPWLTARVPWVCTCTGGSRFPRSSPLPPDCPIGTRPPVTPAGRRTARSAFPRGRVYSLSRRARLARTPGIFSLDARDRLADYETARRCGTHSAKTWRMQNSTK